MFGFGNPELGVLMLALFVVFIMFGFPIAFTLMALGVFFGYWAMGDLIFSLLVQRSYSVMTNDVLISIPLFVFMGYIIERANILDRLFRSLQLAAGPVPASLALATIATCAIFATATGIVGACVTLMGLLAFPAMLRAGYDVKIAAGAVCAGGCLGILIPPSVMLILYGATAGVSVVKLYAGAFFPGIMLAGLYILYTMIMALLNPKLAPRLPLEERNVPFLKIFQALVTSFLPLAALIAAALGSIIFGLATPSEAAAMGSLGALLLAARLRRGLLQALARGGHDDLRHSDGRARCLAARAHYAGPSSRRGYPGTAAVLPDGRPLSHRRNSPRHAAGQFLQVHPAQGSPSSSPPAPPPWCAGCSSARSHSRRSLPISAAMSRSRSSCWR